MSSGDNYLFSSGGSSLGIFEETSGSHRSPRHVESRYLPPYRREEGTSKNFNGERSNPVRTMAPQRLYANRLHNLELMMSHFL